MRDTIALRYNAAMSKDKPDTGELMLYGEIVSNDWKYRETDASALDFDKAVKQLKADGAKKLSMRINSPGGDVYEAVAMRSIICNADFKKVDIRVEGMCASAATFLASIPGARVEITPGSTYMIHNPWTFAIGDANAMEKEIEHLRSIEASSRQMYAKKTGCDEKQLKEWMDAETWFTAEEAVEYGFCDAVASEGRGAFASAAMMSVMRDTYRRVPEAVQQEEPAENIVSSESPVAGLSAENISEEVSDVDIKELTLEQLQEENPALLQQIRESAIISERERVQEIDDMTEPGYEAMAMEAKSNGTTGTDFYKAVCAAKRAHVAEEKAKAAAYVEARVAETAPAQEIVADDVSVDTSMQAYQEQVKKFAAKATNTANGMY